MNNNILVLLLSTNKIHRIFTEQIANNFTKRCILPMLLSASILKFEYSTAIHYSVMQ